MTVYEYLKKHCSEYFRIVTYLNWKIEILYDSSRTKYDVPAILYDSIVENVYIENGIAEIEI